MKSHMLCLLVLATTAGHVLASDEESLTGLTSRFQALENRIQDLEQQVAQQQQEIIDQRALLAEKSREIVDLQIQKEEDVSNARTNYVDLLGKHGLDHSRRFVLDKDDVAFYAKLDETALTGIAMNQTVLFDNVVVNAGNAYNVNTGQFIAPVDGFYLLSVSIASNLGHNHRNQLQVGIMKNDVILARAHAHGDSGHLDQGGVTIVAALASGDKVCIKSTYQDITDLYGEGLATFSGIHIMFK